MKINIEIETDNSAFWNYDENDKPTFYYGEVERILKNIFPKLEYQDSGKAYDINGNSVAIFTVERDSEEEK